MKRNNQSRNGNGLRFRPFLFGLILVILLTFLCSRYVVQLLLIQGKSMEPAYHNWEFVLIDRRGHSFSTGDVVAVRCEGLHTVVIKRIAAVPGDRVVISQAGMPEEDISREGLPEEDVSREGLPEDGHFAAGTLLVNGKPSPLYPEGIFREAGLLRQEQVLEENCFLILGDNTEESVDSRDERVGMVRQEDIIGRLIPQRGFAEH